MLEIDAHNQLKRLLKKDAFIWPHNLTLSRLVARSLRRRDTSLFQIDIGSKDVWWIGLLIPLCIDSLGSVLVLSKNQRNRLLNFELPRLKLEGFNFPCWEGLQPPPSPEKIWLLDHFGLVNAYKSGDLYSKQLILPEAEFLSRRLRNAMAIEVLPKDWDHLRRSHLSADSLIIDLHERLTRRLFTKSTRSDAQVKIDLTEIVALKDLLEILNFVPFPWGDVLTALNQGWASWAVLDYKTLDWNWHLRPLDPLQNLKGLFNQNPFIMINRSDQNTFFLSELEKADCVVKVHVKLGGSLHQEPIPLFVPSRQPLPNSEPFLEYLIDQCRRLILGRSGISILLLDDFQLRRQLASALAAEFGTRVVHEKTAPEINGVVCCSCFWWLENKDHLPAPNQLIIGLLPFASLESPVISAKVEALKKQGRDWFRDFLLPDCLTVLPHVVDPIRGTQGRLAILDGRLRSRSWGKHVFASLQPSIPIHHLLPD